MKPIMKSGSGTTTTRAAILAAVAEVFSREGFKGATTKEICQVAGVHETTLFRHFPNKDVLLQAMVDDLVQSMTESLSQYPENWTDDLHRDLQYYAQVFYQGINTHAPLVRRFIGDAMLHPDACQRVFHSSSACFKTQLIAYLEQAKLLGQVREDVCANKAAGVLTGMLLADVLRRGMMPLEYEPTDYLQTCIDIFVRGIEVAASA